MGMLNLSAQSSVYSNAVETKREAFKSGKMMFGVMASSWSNGCLYAVYRACRSRDQFEPKLAVMRLINLFGADRFQDTKAFEGTSYQARYGELTSTSKGIFRIVSWSL